MQANGDSRPSAVARTSLHAQTHSAVKRDMSTGPLMKEMQWVQPRLVAQIRFVEWTAEGRLRHAKFLGLRQDKPATEIRRE